jgi:formylglycine-generating enzyme required for sulfatase activity
VTKRIIATPISDAPSYAKYALVIGVTDYDSASKLTVCGKDAINFASMLKSRFGFENVVLMTDEAGTDKAMKPTQRNIKKALENLYTGIIPDKSEVVFFYSGHGTRARDVGGNDADWLVPEDGEPRDVPGTCISFSGIRERIATLRPKRVLLITDACRDLLGNKGVGSSGFGATIRGLDLGPQVAEMQSCLPTETSLEGDPRDFKESVFSHYLIKGLSGDPDAVDPDKGAITFDSLKQYVQFSVHLYAAKLHSVQTPDGRATLGGMVLAKYDPGLGSRGPNLNPTPKLPNIEQPIMPMARINPVDGAEMILIPSGKFIMGSDTWPNAPKHTVTLSSYWIYKNLVTVGQYKAFCKATKHPMPVAPKKYVPKDSFPVTNVSYDDALAYGEWAGGTLPTEAQWEKAARGADGRDFPWGPDFDGDLCAGSAEAKRTSPAPVGSFPAGASPYGVLDMAGNVWQWCLDWYQPDGYTTSSPKNPIGPSIGGARVVRGGSWLSDNVLSFRTAYRGNQTPPEWTEENKGFRLAVRYTEGQ